MGTCDHRKLPARRWHLPDRFPWRPCPGLSRRVAQGTGGKKGEIPSHRISDKL